MPKKKKKVEEEAGDGFAVLFTSLSVILLAFFILLNSLATIDGRKRREAMGSLVGSFGILPGGFAFRETGTLIGRDSVMGVTSEDAIFSAFSAEIQRTSISADLSKEGGRWVLRMREDALFDPHHMEISPRYFPLLDKVAEIANTSERYLVVTGYADGGPRFANNWLVSAGRAAAVARFLIEAGSVKSNRVTAFGFGDLTTEPRGARDAKYRRVEVVFE